MEEGEPLPAPSSSTASSKKLIAPLWHTVILLAVIFTISFVGARTLGHGVRPKVPGGVNVHLLLYGQTIVGQWAMIGWIWWGIRKRGVTLNALIGGRWPNWQSSARDVGMAVVFLIGSSIVLNTINKIIPSAPPNLSALAPHGTLELLAGVVLAISAGFCEEVMFRGYLQQQFARITRSGVAGVVLQAVIFGIGHGYQGPSFMVLLGIDGLLFGLLAYWRNSLRPGMLSHALQDSLAMLAHLA